MDVVYFIVNDWDEKYYPNKEPFTTWMYYRNIGKYLLNDDWCKQNKLITIGYDVDMSTEIFVAAQIDWVKYNCPSLLEEDSRFVLSSEQYDTEYPFMYYDIEKIGSYFAYEELDGNGLPFWVIEKFTISEMG